MRACNINSPQKNGNTTGYQLEYKKISPRTSEHSSEERWRVWRAGKFVWRCLDWFQFCIWLDERLTESCGPIKEGNQTNLINALKKLLLTDHLSRFVGWSWTQFNLSHFRWFSSQFTLRGICSNRRRQKHRKHHVPIMHADSTRSRDTSQDVHGRSGAETLGSVAEFKGQETIEVDEDFFSRNQHFFQFHSLLALVGRQTSFQKAKNV